MALRRMSMRRVAAALALLVGLAGGASVASEATDKARLSIEKGDLRSATIELKNRLQKDPNDAAARLLLAQIYLQVGNGAAAEKELRSASDLGADASLWRLELIAALIAQAKYDEALARLDAAADLSAADQVRAFILRADVALGQDQPEVARAGYRQALALDPNSELAGLGLLRVALKEGDQAATVSAADAFLRQFPDNPEALLIRAESYRIAGDNAAALALFERVLAVDPRRLAARLGRATVLIGMQNLDEARKELAKADELQQEVPLTFYLRGVIQFQERNWTQAGESFDRVLSAIPGHLQSQLLLGIIRYSEGELEIADEYLSKVVEATPGNLQARKVLAATRIKQREPQRAIQILEPVAQDGDPQTLALLGSAYMLQGDQERGQEWLNRAVEKAPDVAALRTQLALSLLAGGETGKAIDALQSAVDLGQDILQADVLLVLAHLKKQEYEQALEASKRLEQRRAESPIPYNLTGLAYLAKGDLPSARERFEKALAVDSAFLTAETNLARIDVANKDFDAAARRYDQVLKADPKHLGAMMGLAALAELRNDPDALVAALERAKDASPGAAQPGLLLARFYMTRGDYLKALAVASELSARFPDDEPVLLMLARAQTLGGQVPNAIRSFDLLLQKNPNDPQIHYLAGGARLKGQDQSGAQQAFRQALALKPDFVDAKVALAAVLLDAADTDAALQIARELQQSFPEAAIGYRIEGSVQVARRDLKAAVAVFTTAFAHEKTSLAARQLAEVMSQTGDTGGAVALLEDWVKTNPDDLDVQAMLGLLLQQTGRSQDAIAIYESVMAKAPAKNALLLNNLAWLYHTAGDARAQATAKEAYDLAPNRPEIADTYGWILYNAGRKEDGLSILQQAYLAFPTQTEIGYHVAVALESLGRNDEAIGVLRKVVRDNPNSAQAADAAALLKKLGG
ncbi:XrtA/PEP-CTERM system TPR-repeat protein PrsT [Lamprocystis purpurea]|uniref:XrtA/PEP-CTERM system TPR-repeat protein PrsT n=1 Tax=Lamprocystis purpurea TaxID=61598 RepID=UPI0012F7507E|nr:XrtA/PEP-CTERM system TPR-repeat protein PrsT [Lamprocystis purpurea]